MYKLAAIIMVTLTNSVYSMKYDYLQARWFQELGEYTKKVCTKAKSHPEMSNSLTTDGCDDLRTLFGSVVYRAPRRSWEKSVLSRQILTLVRECKISPTTVEKEIESALEVRRKMIWGSFFACITKWESTKEDLCVELYAKKWGL